MNPQPSTTKHLSVPVDRLQAFDPQSLGVYQADFRDLVSTFVGRPQSEIVRQIDGAIDLLGKDTRRDPAAYEATLLVLRDYILGGFYPIVNDGHCFLASIWDSTALTDSQRRAALQRLYEGMRQRNLAGTNDIPRLSETVQHFEDSGAYNPPAIVRLIAAGALDPYLMNATNTTDRQLWRAARATWSMAPDKSAPGREVSFLVTDRRYPATPIGIFQFRNVVPEIRARDTWFGTVVTPNISNQPYSGYAGAISRSGDMKGAIKSTCQTVSHLLESVNPEGIGQPLSDRDEAQLYTLSTGHRAAFNEARRVNSSDAKHHLAVAKRAETASELCRGLRGLQEVLASNDPLEALNDQSIAARCETGLRKIWHYHMGFVAVELSICGAAPPFGALRAGKLMASLAGSAEALAAWGYERPLGEIARQVYLPEVRERVPNPGPIMILTSGLYPGHSAQYNRLKSGSQPWIRYGDTSGYGSFHISNATFDATGRFNNAVDGYKRISRTFGEGSGARFRDVGRALERLNLPDLRRHNTQRPLYVLPLVDDVAGVLLGWRNNPTPSRPTTRELTEQWMARWVDPQLDRLVDQTSRGFDLLQTLRSLHPTRPVTC